MRFRFGEFELDDRLFTLERAGEHVGVRRQILDVILYLVRERDRVVTKSELHAHLWPDTAVGANSLATAINEARSTLGDDGQTRAVIDTVYGRGYRFVLPVQELADEPLRDEIAEASGPLRFGLLSRLFVGREDLLARLEDAATRAAEGDWRVVLLSGEMGIGKSRTVEEFARRLDRCGSAIVLGRCEGGTGAPAFWVWAQVVRQLCDAHSDAQLRDYMGPGASELAQIEPEVRRRLPGLRPSPRLEGEQARFRLFDSMLRFLRRCAERQPLVLVLEDLHAGDVSSLELVRFLARSSQSQRILVVATYRDVELLRDEDRARALRDLLNEPRVESCPMVGLAASEVGRYVEGAIEAKASEEVIGELHRRTSGNPFFLHHLVLNVAAIEGVEAMARRPESLRTLPASLRDAIQGRIDRLPETGQRLLGAASVVGRDFGLSLLEALTEWPRERILSALQTVIDAGIVSVHPERVSHFRFGHMMVRDALYQSLPELARARLHERAGAALEKLHGAERHRILSELAHHAFHAARLGGEQRALDLALEAARQAAARMGHAEAAELLERALELLELRGGGDVERCDVLIDLGTAQTRAGRRDAAQDTIERATQLARALGDATRLARSALALEAGFLGIESGFVDQRLIALLEEALEAVGPDAPALEAHLLARLVQSLHWSEDAAARDRFARRAAALGGPGASARVRMYAASAIHGNLWTPDRLDERLDYAREVIGRAESEEDWETALLHHLFLITGLLEKGELDELRRERITFATLADRIRQPQSSWYPKMFEASDALREGRLDEVEPLAVEFVAIARGADDRNAIQSFGSLITYLRWQTNRLAEVQDFFEKLATRFDGFPPWRFARAAVHAELGASVQALERLDDALSDRRRTSERDSSWLVSTALAAQAASICGREEMRLQLYEELLPFADRNGVIGFGVIFWGSVAHWLARLAASLEWWDVAERHFEDGLARNQRMRARMWSAQARADWARMLLARGDSEGRRRAAVLLSEAAAETEVMGMSTLGNQIAGLIRDLG